MITDENIIRQDMGALNVGFYDELLNRRQDKIDANGITGVQSNLDIWNAITFPIAPAPSRDTRTPESKSGGEHGLGDVL